MEIMHTLQQSTGIGTGGSTCIGIGNGTTIGTCGSA